MINYYLLNHGLKTNELDKKLQTMVVGVYKKVDRYMTLTDHFKILTLTTWKIIQKYNETHCVVSKLRNNLILDKSNKTIMSLPGIKS